MKSIIFKVWAPLKKSMVLHLVTPYERKLEMTKGPDGYFNLPVNDLPENVRYFFMPDGEKDYPDPASSFQPEGVHGASQIIDHAAYNWNDSNWKGLSLEEMIFYEIHVGTFTKEGSFEAIIPRLDELMDTGINAIEIMPVSQFPGERNWGYDGVYPYAVQHSYGGPDGLKKLVDACHRKGIAVFLDVVYNHLGPEGNYLSQYGPYFTDKYKSFWGQAINFDGEWCDGVRDYFAGNALFWFRNYHIDGLRADAIHAVFDNGAVHFWEYMHEKVKQLEKELHRSLYLVAESDLNSPNVIKKPEAGGYGFDAQWLDDFHHALYVLLNPGDRKRYIDFGSMQQLAKAFREGFVHSGEWVQYRKRKHGRSSAGVPGNRFIAFNLNHDQIGNRVDGKRLSMLVNFERQKLAAAALMLSPYIPMLFMGEEYGDKTPFYYFVSHSDPQIIEAVKTGRKEEFKDFGFDREPADAQDEKTFLSSKIHWEKRNAGRHAILLAWHRELIRMRKSKESLRNFSKADMEVECLGENGLLIHRRSVSGNESLFCVLNFSEKNMQWKLPEDSGACKRLLDSKEGRWMEDGLGSVLHPAVVNPGEGPVVAALSVVVYEGGGDY